MNSFRPISNLTILSKQSKEPLRSDSSSTLSCTSYCLPTNLLIIRDHFKARPVDVKWKPRLFELQLLRIHLNRKRTLLIANIYQPVSSPSSDFFEELDELFSRSLVDPSDVLVCGDFNCPGSSNGRVSDRLEDVLIIAARPRTYTGAQSLGYSRDVRSRPRIFNSHSRQSFCFGSQTRGCFSSHQPCKAQIFQP